jgi:H+/Cl- antiporter ClcA
MQKTVILEKLRSASRYILAFVRWGLLAALTGLVGGGVGTLFHKAVEYATGVRLAHSWILYLLPLGGLLIVGLYHLLGTPEGFGTNQILDAIRGESKVPLALAPLIFLSTVITHLCGGSAGREGAALQLGGSIGSQLGGLFHLDEKDRHILIMCGMSAVFAALFGTPLTATFFAMEVISIGVIYYAGLVPCIISSLTAYGVSLLFGAEPVRFSLTQVPDPSILTILQVIALSALCAALSILFCLSMHKTGHLLQKWIPNGFLRAFLGGCAILLLTLLVGTTAYNGAGMDSIAAAISGSARPEAFALKILFTAVTIGAGFKGGEIVPTFFIGSTFGCVAGSLLGLDPGFGAAVGLIALFCGVVNSPIASMLLSIELFGAQGLLLFTIACGVSFMLSGYYGLYSSQKIVYSKLRAEYINIHAK